ncbi:nicotinamide riboside transporter PnuC [Vaginella massiliensis]|uniref:nicotinamide riboside transporter PnuC n=1 Tax=Vaginella massiliensis TaxID=1816680 RepID=UPI000837D0A1|nr:nicotinamide riboside transporter PnuC [Vaginella massiliensis]
MSEFLQYLVAPYTTYSATQIAMEATATFFGVLSVFFSMKRNIWVYPTGIVSTFLYIYLYFTWGLYGETLINFYYTVMSIYGWFLWSRNVEDDQIHVEVNWASKLDYLKSAALFAITFLLILVIYYYRPLIENGFDLSASYSYQHHYSTVDYIDASLTGIFLIGMWMMAKRKIDNWIFWIAGDLAMVPLLLYKGYAISSFQYMVFTLLAINGLVEWQKTARNQSIIK